MLSMFPAAEGGGAHLGIQRCEERGWGEGYCELQKVGVSRSVHEPVEVEGNRHLR